MIPKGKAFSPRTKTSSETAIDALVINIDPAEGEGIDSFPDPVGERPGQATLSQTDDYSSEDPTTYETITYTERDTVNNQLKGVTRAVEGTAQGWPAGTVIACHITDYQIEQIVTNIESVETDLATAGSDITTVEGNIATLETDTETIKETLRWGAI